MSVVYGSMQDGNIAYTIVTAPATSTDPIYNNLNASDVSVANTDNDVAGITVNPTAGLTTTEAGGAATFTGVPARPPPAKVPVGVSTPERNAEPPMPPHPTTTHTP